MARLNEILGALMADIVSARHLADQHTLQLASRSRKDPRLRGVSVPRIRLSEVVIDLPLLIERCGEAHKAEAPEVPATSPETNERAREFLSTAEQTLRDLGPAASSSASGSDGAPVLHVLVGADELKEHGGPAGANLMRLKLVLREEALEWTADESPPQDGKMERWKDE